MIAICITVQTVCFWLGVCAIHSVLDDIADTLRRMEGAKQDEQTD